MMPDQQLQQLVEQLIPDAELHPQSIARIPLLPAFSEKMQAMTQALGAARFDQLPLGTQQGLVLRRLQQMVNTVLLNPYWRERLAAQGINQAPQSFADWQQIPISDKAVQWEAFMGDRPGLVVPLEHGGFEVVASGGTSSGQAVEIVYSLRELWDTYKIAGHFMGNHMLNRYLSNDGPRWLATTLADYQMWSSGTMVGGVLQHTPGINYIGAGPLLKETFQHMMSYPGDKAIMGITAGIGFLTELGAGLDQAKRDTLRVAMYGSGVMPEMKRKELKSLYPNVDILSYFAATQAETIGLQLNAESPDLAAVPGLHLIEIVDENGQWVAEGEEGELVVTRLHAHEAPFLRYKIGDRMVRCANIGTDQLNTMQFRFAGRSSDVLHLNDTQYSAPRALEALTQALDKAGLVDLNARAHELQFLNQRRNKTLSLLVAVDNPALLNAHVNGVLGLQGVHNLFIQALTDSLSIFNQGEANAASMESTGYRYQLLFLAPGSTEIMRTSVGKTPLLHDLQD